MEEQKPNSQLPAVRTGRKKNILKWHEQPELYASLLSLAALLALIIVSVYLNYIREGILFHDVWVILGYHMTGGAAFGALKGAGTEGLTLLDNILLNSLFASFIICTFNALFALSCRGLLHLPFLKKIFSSMQNDVKGQKRTWVKFGVPGIFAFVLFPLTGTGPLIGTVLGRLIGLGFWTNLFTVLSANLTTVLGIALLGEKFSERLGEKQLGHIVFSVILILIACAAIIKFLSWLRNRRDGNRPSEKS